MYERLNRDKLSYVLPYQLCELRLEGQPQDPLKESTIVGTLAQQCAGLAGVIHTASLHPETCEQDLSQALAVLAGYLHTLHLVWQRYQEEAPLWTGRPREEDGTPRG
jgi:hypothetical protein